MRYQVKERTFSLNDAFIIFDERGEAVFEASGRIFHIGDRFTLWEKQTGEEILCMKQRIFAHTKQYELFSKTGEELATLRKKPNVGPHGERFDVTTRDGMVLSIQGDFHQWDFKIIDHYGRLLGNISREWTFPLTGDRYTVDIAPGVDAPFILALAILLDEIREDDGKD